MARVTKGSELQKLNDQAKVARLMQLRAEAYEKLKEEDSEVE